MGIVYLLVVFFVTCLLLSPLMYPYYKVWKNLKDNHPDVWAAKGPFDVRAMLADGRLVQDFLNLLNDGALAEKDPALGAWMRRARDLGGLWPKSFWGQIAAVLVFLYFVSFFTSLILGLFA